MFRLSSNLLVFKGNGGSTERWICLYENNKGRVCFGTDPNVEHISNYYKNGLNFYNIAYWAYKVDRPRNIDSLLRHVSEYLIGQIKESELTEDELKEKLRDINIFLVPLINTDVWVDEEIFKSRFSNYKDNFINDLVETPEIAFKTSIMYSGCLDLVENSDILADFKEWLENDRPDLLTDNEITSLMTVNGTKDLREKKGLLVKISHLHILPYAIMQIERLKNRSL